MHFKNLVSPCIVLVSGSLARTPTPFSSIIVFGDSFSDNGNGSYRITNYTWPLAVYNEGRFSNGPIWAENIATNLSISLYDYAFGGATTSNALVQGYTGANSDIPVPGIAEQVAEFLSTDSSEIRRDSSLFVLFGGFNDIFFNPNLTSAQIVRALWASATTLIDSGARHFLFLNYYDAAQIPYDQYADVGTKRTLQTFSDEFPQQLSLLTNTVSQELAGKSSRASVTYVNLLLLYRHFYFYGEPIEYGFDVFGAYGSCLIGAYGETANITQCSDPDRRVFWDEYHPSKRSHQIMADYILSKL
ncbi:SGNH hydrolase [Tothia fuscella]|uniref:SGNH hydrolase n=1 Tax=Tothia fuscella TaxID=1048955 RepID=A0A9P4NGJ3_9PEZI|nr:SGNH hydrolase [Tothia fuscella]